MAKLEKDSNYQQAHVQWDQRLCQADSQLKSWRIAALVNGLIALVLLLGIIIIANSKKQYVYVAQVAPATEVKTIRPASFTTSPTAAMKQAWLAGFIHRINVLPLDPVIFRNNWLSAYADAQGSARSTLTKFALQVSPEKDLGKLTRVCEIVSYHTVSANSYNYTWTTTSYDRQGHVVERNDYNGLFTLAVKKQANNPQAILDDPLGLTVTYLNITKEG